jgi:hypothetical protein
MISAITGAVKRQVSIFDKGHYHIYKGQPVGGVDNETPRSIGRSYNVSAQTISRLGASS